MDGGLFALWVVALAFLTFWLSLYVYVLYAFGKKLAGRFRLAVSPLPAAVVISALSLLIPLAVIPFDLQALPKLTLMFGLWLIHAQAISIGYWSGYDILRKLDEERWERNAEEWVTDYEERPPEFMKDFEDR